MARRNLVYLILMGCAVALLFIAEKPTATIEYREKTDTIRVIERVVEEVYVVTATVYHAVESQCDSDCLVTASGARIASADGAYEHRYLAVSRDLLDVFPYGTMVEVSGCGELDGVYTVADTLNKRYKGYIDILINPDMRGGKWERVRIKKVG